MYSRNLSFDIRHIIQNNKKSIEFDTHTQIEEKKKHIEQLYYCHYYYDYTIFSVRNGIVFGCLFILPLKIYRYIQIYIYKYTFKVNAADKHNILDMSIEFYETIQSVRL